MPGNRKYRDAYYPVRKVTDLKDMINSSAELYGERTAYLVKNRPGGRYMPVSYIQLKSDIDAFGTALIELGLKGKHIGVIGETRYEWIVAELSAASGVGVAVPFDKELPVDELKNLIERAHLSAIVYSGKVEKLLMGALDGAESLEYIISMDAESSDEDRLSMHALIERGHELVKKGERSYIDAEIDPDAMHILLFTSGTTGLAKGVMISHKNIISNVMNMSQFVHVNADDVSLSILPIHHTYEFTCNHMTVLFQGGTVAICEGLKHIVKNMAEAQATIMLGVPLVFEMMHKRVWKQAEKTGKASKLRKGLALAKTLDKFNIKSMKKLFKDVHSAFGGHMRMFICGAAALDPEIIEDFNYMGIDTFQGYGMTECSPIIAVHRDRYHEPAASVGPAVPGTEILIDDPDSDGVGEILVKSDSVMLGYYEAPEETAKVMRDGWMRTGDYGYLDKDGMLFITGRKKNVIVTKNGKNIFPEEVEYYLLKSPYIKEVIVDGIEDGTGELIVTAHIVPDEDELKSAGEMDEAQKRKFFKKIIDDVNDGMSSYKRVKRFELRTEEFEKTSTRKIKRYGSNTQNK